MSRQRESRLEVVRRALREFSTQIEAREMEMGEGGLKERIEKHLLRLPRQYAMDVSFLDDIVAHMELLSTAESDTRDDASETTRNKSGICCTCREVDVSRADPALCDVAPMMEDTMMAESEPQGVPAAELADASPASSLPCVFASPPSASPAASFSSQARQQRWEGPSARPSTCSWPALPPSSGSHSTPNFFAVLCFFYFLRPCHHTQETRGSGMWYGIAWYGMVWYGVVLYCMGGWV